MGERISIDESMHSKDLFTFLSDGHGKYGTLIAAVCGTKSEDVVRPYVDSPRAAQGSKGGHYGLLRFNVHHSQRSISKLFNIKEEQVMIQILRDNRRLKAMRELAETA